MNSTAGPPPLSRYASSCPLSITVRVASPITATPVIYRLVTYASVAYGGVSDPRRIAGRGWILIRVLSTRDVGEIVSQFALGGSPVLQGGVSRGELGQVWRL